MNRLMFRWLDWRLMADDNGGGGGDPPPSDPPPADPNPNDPPPADPPPSDPPPNDPPKDPPPKDDDITSAIAQKTAKPNDPPPANPNPNDPPPAIDAETSKIPDEDYTKALIADDETKKLAANDKIELSPELVKNMLPHLKAAGVKPEQASALANSLAREQIRAEQARVAERIANCKKMNEDALKAYPTQEDWDLMAAGMEHFFKPGGAMHYTITHSELGADPEFLALMKYVGEKVRADKGAGASTPTGGGQTKVNMAKALGIT